MVGLQDLGFQVTGGRGELMALRACSVLHQRPGQQLQRPGQFLAANSWASFTVRPRNGSALATSSLLKLASSW